ncbi:MAG: hypothetical protein WA484_06200 [Solirubrobacteraceae bacterium]
MATEDLHDRPRSEDEHDDRCGNRDRGVTPVFYLSPKFPLAERQGGGSKAALVAPLQAPHLGRRR